MMLKRGILLAGFVLAGLALVLFLGIPEPGSPGTSRVSRSHRRPSSRGGRAHRSAATDARLPVVFDTPSFVERMLGMFIGPIHVVGHVEDESGVAVTGALVRAIPEPGAVALDLADAVTTTTDIAGDFELTLPSGTKLVALRASTDDPARGVATKRHLRPRWGDLDAGTLTLVAPCAITGRVVDTGGSPIKGAHVFESTTRLGAVVSKRAETWSDAQGSFTFPCSPRGRIVQVFAEHEGYASLALSNARCGGPPLTLTLAREAFVRGTVRDDAGRPIEGAAVFVDYYSGIGKFDHQSSPFVARSDGSGAYTIARMSAGGSLFFFSVRCDAPGFSAERATVDGRVPGAHVVDFTLFHGTAVSGTVVDAVTGSPIAAADVGGRMARTDVR
ncbi:MAG: carboxypeptidase regulatory-like domain-containing protein, partial [Planctomycetes bacterium]|nr:carboxypeptidase regulatory-like domain-containing protein [Planctomycetota bacterium]